MSGNKPEKIRARTGIATGAIIGGSLLAYISLPSDSAADVFETASIAVGLSLAIATAVEGVTGGVRNLIRIDILMLWVLYGLTLLEFLFPQKGVDSVISADAA